MGPSRPSTLGKAANPGGFAAAAFCGAAFAVLAPSFAHAELVERRSTETYVFQVGARQDWHDAMMAATPIREDGHRFAGYTRWEIRWNYSYAPGSRGCRMTEVDVELEVEITLPRMRKGPHEGAAEFAEFLEGLERHEEGHYRIARRAAEAIDAYLREVRNESCDELSRIANDRPDRILEETRSREKRYDKVTRHGREQEAWRE